MMKLKHIIPSIIVGCGLTVLTSCNDYLDKLPDDRATVDTKEKVAKLISSAYPTVSTILISEISSENAQSPKTKLSHKYVLQYQDIRTWFCQLPL